jgi:hypothetical protein
MSVLWPRGAFSCCYALSYPRNLFFRPFDCRFRRGQGFLSENIRYDDRIGVNAADDAPVRSDVDNPQFVTPSSDGRHRPRMRHFQAPTPLKVPEQESRFKPCLPGKWR